MRFVKIYCMLIFCLIFIGHVKAQVSSTASSIGIDANVIAPITIGNSGSSEMNFGTITRSSVAGTVILTADGSRTATGGVAILGSSSFTAAPFAVTGESNASFTITLPTSNVTLTRDGSTETMTVNAFTHNSGLKLSSSGTAEFSVGATLNVNADQVPGLYHGTFSVTIAYQ